MMENKALWFMWFVILALSLFASISISRYYAFHPFLVTAIIGVIITAGALLHFHLSGNIKEYPIRSFTEVWKDRHYGEPVLYVEGVKYDMHFMPWDEVTKISVTTTDHRSGTNVVLLDKAEHVHVMNIHDIEGFKNAIANHSQFTIEYRKATEI
jgi:hypothetical protein